MSQRPGSEPSPLAGKTVVVTRAEPAPGPLERKLLARGARVLRWTTIAIGPPDDPVPLADAIDRLTSFDWLVVTSAHAVAALAGHGAAPGAGGKPRVAAVGTATAEELATLGWRVDLLPTDPGAAGLLAAFADRDGLAGRRVLYPASSLAASELSDGLRQLGAEVERIEAYRTVTVALDREDCLRRLAAGEVDAVTFASPSAVRGLAASLGAETFPVALAEVASIAIGPTTARAMRELGLEVAAEASPSTLDGLVAATSSTLASRPAREPAGALSS